MDTQNILDQLASEQDSYQGYLQRGNQAINDFDMEKLTHDGLDLAYKQGKGLAKQMAQQVVGERTMAEIESSMGAAPLVFGVGKAGYKFAKAASARSNYEKLTGKKFDYKLAKENQAKRIKLAEARGKAPASGDEPEIRRIPAPRYDGRPIQEPQPETQAPEEEPAVDPDIENLRARLEALRADDPEPAAAAQEEPAAPQADLDEFGLPRVPGIDAPEEPAAAEARQVARREAIGGTEVVRPSELPGATQPNLPDEFFAPGISNQQRQEFEDYYQNWKASQARVQQLPEEGPLTQERLQGGGGRVPPLRPTIDLRQGAEEGGLQGRGTRSLRSEVVYRPRAQTEPAPPPARERIPEETGGQEMQPMGASAAEPSGIEQMERQYEEPPMMARRRAATTTESIKAPITKPVPEPAEVTRAGPDEQFEPQAPKTLSRTIQEGIQMREIGPGDFAPGAADPIPPPRSAPQEPANIRPTGVRSASQITNEDVANAQARAAGLFARPGEGAGQVEPRASSSAYGGPSKEYLDNAMQKAIDARQASINQRAARAAPEEESGIGASDIAGGALGAVGFAGGVAEDVKEGETGGTLAASVSEQAAEQGAFMYGGAAGMGVTGIVDLAKGGFTPKTGEELGEQSGMFAGQKVGATLINRGASAAKSAYSGDAGVQEIQQQTDDFAAKQATRQAAIKAEESGGAQVAEEAGGEAAGEAAAEATAIGASEAAEASIPGLGEIAMGITGLVGLGLELFGHHSKAPAAPAPPPPLPPAPQMKSLSFYSAPTIDSSSFHEL